MFLVITVTTLVLHGVDAPTATRILRHHSTNLVQMSRDAPRVLFLSAFLLDQGRLLVELALFTVVLVPLERWLGTYRWLAVFAAGHIGATLATTIGIWLEVRGGAGARSLVYPVDVGVSYGLVASAAVLTFRLPRLASGAWALGLCGLIANSLIRSGTFTDWGHLAALAVGFALSPLVAPVVVSRRPVGPSAFAPQPSWLPASLARPVAQAWHWISTPPPPLLARVRRRAVLVLGGVLLAASAALLALLQTTGETTIPVPASGPRRQATVIGPVPGCGPDCRTLLVQYPGPGGETQARLTLPPHTMARPGQRLTVIANPAVPRRVTLPRRAGRVKPDGLMGAIAAAAGSAGLVLVAASRRRRGRNSDSPTAGGVGSAVESTLAPREPFTDLRDTGQQEVLSESAKASR